MSDQRATFTALAQALGVSLPYVTKLKKAGRLVLTDDGRACLLSASLARIEATRDPSAIQPATSAVKNVQGAADSAHHGRDKCDAHTESGDELDPLILLRPDYQEARAKREHYNAELARLSFEKENGRLIDIHSVREIILGGVTALRTRLEQLGEKHGIQGEVEYALEDLQHHFVRIEGQRA